MQERQTRSFIQTQIDHHSITHELVAKTSYAEHGDRFWEKVVDSLDQYGNGRGKLECTDTLVYLEARLIRIVHAYVAQLKHSDESEQQLRVKVLSTLRIAYAVFYLFEKCEHYFSPENKPIQDAVEELIEKFLLYACYHQATKDWEALLKKWIIVILEPLVLPEEKIEKMSDQFMQIVQGELPLDVEEFLVKRAEERVGIAPFIYSADNQKYKPAFMVLDDKLADYAIYDWSKTHAELIHDNPKTSAYLGMVLLDYCLSLLNKAFLKCTAACSCRFFQSSRRGIPEGYEVILDEVPSDLESDSDSDLEQGEREALLPAEEREPNGLSQRAN